MWDLTIWRRGRVGSDYLEGSCGIRLFGGALWDLEGPCGI